MKLQTGLKSCIRCLEFTSNFDADNESTLYFVLISCVFYKSNYKNFEGKHLCFNFKEKNQSN